MTTIAIVAIVAAVTLIAAGFAVAMYYTVKYTG